MADSMESPEGPKLLQQAEKILLHPIHPHLISYCPTIDLIALVTDEENLDVYRINGQRAFGLKRKSSDVSVDCICWEYNGQGIAVSWSDGATDVVSAETGKVIHKDVPAPRMDDNGDERGEEGADQNRRIASIEWGLNFIGVDAVKRRMGLRKKRGDGLGETTLGGETEGLAFEVETTEDWDKHKDATTLESFLDRQPDLAALDISPSLPDQLAMMDLETLQPKLPAIPLPPATPFMMVRPGQQVDSGAFSSQAQVDSLLHSQHLKDYNSVDMFVRCTRGGSVHPSIYDSLETVDVRLPDAWGVKKSRVRKQASHPYCCSHGLLTEVQIQGTSKLAFVPLTLGFIPSAGIYLHLIASKTSQLQNLLLYLQQCLQRVRTFWRHSRDLPERFMRNIEEPLEEKDQGGLVENLYHLACTGNCPELVRDWLVDELQEAGHKRWDTTVTASLTTVLQILHENLLPALDRCTIIISRLRGLAQYHTLDTFNSQSGWIFKTPVSHFTTLLELVKNLRLLSHTTLSYVNDERRLFHAFSKWLRYEIDFETTEPDSQSRLEMEARDPGVDVSSVLEYIRYCLTRSDLTPYFLPEEQLNDDQRHVPASSYEDTRKAIELLKEEAEWKKEALCMEFVLRHFGEGCTTLFQQISQWQEDNVSMDCGVVLEDEFQVREEDGDGGKAGVMDMRMVFEPTPTTPDTIATYILLSSSTSPSHLHIHKLTHDPTIDTLPRALHAYAATTLAFPGSVLDAVFADDDVLLVLLKRDDEEGTCVILFVEYTTGSSDSMSTSTTKATHQSSQTQPQPQPQPITYTPLSPSKLPSHFLPTGSALPASKRLTISFSTTAIAPLTRHVFNTRFTPLKIRVNGRVGRRVILALGSDRKHYRVLDMDFQAGKGKGNEVGEKEDGGSENGSGEERSDIDMEVGAEG